MPDSRRQQGFTLIEVTVAVAIFSLLSYGIIALISNLVSASNQQSALLSDSDQARKLSFQIMTELRNAVTSNTGAYPLEQANDQQIVFYSNADGGAAVERIRYFLQNGSMMKGVVKPTGSPFTYNLAQEAVATVQKNVVNSASTPLFYYFNDTYDGTTQNFLSQPVNVTQVRFTQLNLQISNKAGKSGSANFYTVTAGAGLRNLKTNLGD